MSDYVTLLGTEEVSRAASSMRSAAQEMHSAANLISQSIADMKQANQQFLDDFRSILSDAKLL